MSEVEMIVEGILVGGTTYRIVRLKLARCEAVRVLDNVVVGNFSLARSLVVEPVGIGAELMREIARDAVQGAETNWVCRTLAA